MGFDVAVAREGTISPVKLEELSQILKIAAEDYRAARFIRAIERYDQALQLAGERESVDEPRNIAVRMREAQRRAREGLPEAKKDQRQTLEDALTEATALKEQGQYIEAYHALFKLWVTAGDFKGKTLRLLRESQGRLPGDYEPIELSALIDAGPDLTIQQALPEGDAAAIPADRSPVAPEAFGTELTKARAAIQMGYYDGARVILEGIMAVAPEHPVAVRELARLEGLETAAEGEARTLLDQIETDRQGADAAQAGVPREVAQAASQPATRTAAPPTTYPEQQGYEVENIEEESQGERLLVNPDAGSMADDATRIRVNTLVKEAGSLAEQGYMEEAHLKLNVALELWPESPAATKLASSLDDRRVSSPPPQGEVVPEPPILSKARRVGQMGPELEVLYRRAQEAYDRGDLRQARELWAQMLEIEPGNAVAETWLEETEEAMQRLAADEAEHAEYEMRQEEARVLLDAPVSITTERMITLQEFMHSLSLTTPVELQFNISAGADSLVTVNYYNLPLREVLDNILKPRGLDWSIDENNVITISPALVTGTYTLSPSQRQQTRALLDAGRLQQIIWGQIDKPYEQVDITLDEHKNVLMVTGSKVHIDRIESFLEALTEDVTSPAPEVRIYKINPDDGARIKSLVNSLIAASETPSGRISPFDVERKIFIDGEDLIIRDTPENMRKVEDLLVDHEFIDKLRDEKLDIASFSLVPRDWDKVDEEFIANVVEMIEAFLYAREGKMAAESEGRRLMFDSANLNLTVIDTPTRTNQVGEYLDQLPQFRRESLQKIVSLEYAIAEEMTSNLENILGLSSGGRAGGLGGKEVMLLLSRGDERQLPGGGKLRLVRVEVGGGGDRSDDTAEFALNTGSQSSSVQLRELDTQYIDEYELTAEDIYPSHGMPGEGRARIRVRLVQQFGLDSAPEVQVQQELDAARLEEEEGISFTPIGTLNTLIIRYTNLPLLEDALELIEQLDQPTLQVEIETKFVEVNETRAKEVSSDFNLRGFGTGRDLDWNNNLINSRFAQDLDEYRDVFGPPIENPFNANLIKGTTIFDAVIGTFPNIQYSLRLLEAEGIINIVNGPKVLALDGQEAEFRIEMYIPQDTGGDFQGEVVDLFNQWDDAFNDLELHADQDRRDLDSEGLINAVVLRVTPEITSPNSIILSELTAELFDFGGWLADVLQPQVNDVDDLTEDSFFTPVTFPQATANIAQLMTVKRKKLVTHARIRNGGTIVIGGWTGERTQNLTSGIPVLRNMPFFGKILFSRSQRTSDRTTLLIFLTCNLVD
jgi:type II secretory pathway component GspD/PulD (secretin)/putative hemolysin